MGGRDGGNSVPGCFVTFEGIDGAGKTTQLHKVATWLREQGISLEVTREPGGTPLGEEIRRLLLKERYDIEQRAEVLLYASARAQHVEERIRPALDAGKWVLCDRFTDASIAYQAYGLGAPLHWVREVNRFATGGLSPHRSYLFDLPIEVSRSRLSHRPRQGELDRVDRMEERSDRYFERVREGFLQLAREEGQRMVLLDARESEEQVFQKICRDLKHWLSA